jgi:hypothetical protein
MYLASRVGKWSTTQIGKFYNGRDHSTVCYAIARIRTLCELDKAVDGIVAVLAEEIGAREESIGSGRRPKAFVQRKACSSLLDDAVLEAVAERIASLILCWLIPRGSEDGCSSGIEPQCGGDAGDTSGVSK